MEGRSLVTLLTTPSHPFNNTIRIADHDNLRLHLVSLTGFDCRQGF